MNRWDLGKSQQLSRLDPSVPGHYLIVFVDQNWVGKPKFLNRSFDLLDLFALMRACIARIRFQLRNFAIGD